MYKKLFIHIIFIVFYIDIYSQKPTQQITGIVIDKSTQQPLPGASIIVNSKEQQFSTATNEKGYFIIKDIPIGRITVTVSFIGYQLVTLPNMYLSSGKSLQLSIEMEEAVITYEEVVVAASKQKIRPNNEMALISARAFTIEETERYAGSRGDVARMASNYAGVAFANDQRNDIIIRGNSPSGLLWRLDDVDIPNPNHFAENGTTGGPVSMLNNNVLRNSDFFTGAFPAEYGNALSGVFDLKMRNGNILRHEYTIQSGFNGLELGVEGPINKSNNSSFMAYYRYSFLDLMDKMGFNFGTSGVPEYQDLIFKANYPLKKGSLQTFILAGKSQIAMLSSKLDSNNIYTSEGQDLYNHSKMGVFAVTYIHFINDKSYLKTTFSGLYQNGGTTIDTLDENNQNPFRYLIHNIDEYRATFSSHYSLKHSASLTSKIGLQMDQMGYKLESSIYSEDSLRLIPYLKNSKSLTQGPQLWHGYYQAKYKFSVPVELSMGLHYLYFTLNRTQSLEPRISIAYKYNPKATLSIGYGLHSHTQSLATYYYGQYHVGVGYLETNKNLDFSKAHHYVIGNEWNLKPHLRMKTEIYYQYLFNIPVSKSTQWLSLINSGANWGLSITDSLINKGTGENYGMEITFEQFFNKNFYFLLTTSLYRSYYKGYDLIKRHTSFDGNYIVNFLTGYEHPLKNNWTISFDTKLSTAGGKRYIPIDLEKSIKSGETKYYEDQIFTKQYEPFFKIDIKIAIKHNKPLSTQELQFYVENVTNHRNPLYEYYNATRKKITRIYQLGLFPMILWRLTF